MTLGLNSYITSAGLKAITSAGSLGPYFAIKYFLPIYDYRIDKTICRGTSSSTSALDISTLNLVSATSDTLFGEKIFNNSNYSLASSTNAIFWSTNLTGINQGGNSTILGSKQSVATDFNIVNNAPVSKIVSGSNVSTDGIGTFNISGTNLVNAISYNPISGSNYSLSAFYPVQSYSPNSNGLTSATGTFKCAIPASNGTFKFNGLALYAIKVDEAGFVDNDVYNFAPVLFGVVLFDEAQIKQDTTGGVNNFEINVDLNFDWSTYTSATNTPVYIDTDYWVKLPDSSTTSAYGLSYDGDIVIACSAVPNSWTPRAKTTIVDNSQAQLRLSNDNDRYSTFRVTRFSSYNGTSALNNDSDRAVLNIDTSCPSDSLLNIGDNNSSIGIRTVAIGSYTSAFGDFNIDSGTFGTPSINGYSIATGLKTLSTGYLNLSFGNETTAAGQYNIAGGYQSLARTSTTNPISTQYDGNIAIGYQTSAITNLWSTCNSYGFSYSIPTIYGGNIAIGYNTFSTGSVSLAGGYKSVANGTAAISYGLNTSALSCVSIALGIKSIAYNEMSLSFGYNAIAGDINNSNSLFAISLGENTSATNYHSIAIGYNTIASNTGSIAIGMNPLYSSYYTNASGDTSIAIGANTSATGYSSIAIGSYYQSFSNGTIVNADGALGIGPNIYIDSAAKYSTAIGYNLSAYSTNSFTVGNNIINNGNNSLAIGSYINNNGNCNTTIGFNTSANGNNSFVGGFYSNVKGDSSFTYGNSNSISGNSNIALGTNLVTSGNYTYSIGYNNTINATSAIAIGSNISVTTNSQINIGSCDYLNTYINSKNITIGSSCTNKIIISADEVDIYNATFNNSYSLDINYSPKDGSYHMKIIISKYDSTIDSYVVVSSATIGNNNLGVISSYNLNTNSLNTASNSNYSYWMSSTTGQLIIREYINLGTWLPNSSFSTTQMPPANDEYYFITATKLGSSNMSIYFNNYITNFNYYGQVSNGTAYLVTPYTIKSNSNGIRVYGTLKNIINSTVSCRVGDTYQSIAYVWHNSLESYDIPITLLQDTVSSSGYNQYANGLIGAAGFVVSDKHSDS